MDKQFLKKTFIKEIENHLADIRLRNQVKKLHPVHMTTAPDGTED